MLNGNWQGIKFSTRGISIKWSEERKAKHSLAMCGRKRSPLSEESKRKISMRKRGHRSWLGLTHSEETKLKLSKIAKNRPEETISKMKNSLKRFYEENNVSQETRDKISKANTGKKRSAESRKKYSECQRGLQKTEEHRKNIKESRLSTYVLEDINGNQTVIRENFRTWCKANDLSERILLRSLETKEFFKGFTLKSTTKKIK